MDKELHDIEETLITKHLLGEATAEEERTLSTWIDASDANRIRFEKSKAALGLAVKHRPRDHEDLNIDVNEEWHRFLKNVDTDASDNVVRMPTSTTWLRVAAAILLVAVSGFVINYFIGNASEVVYQTAENTEVIVLPDNSEVTLNRYSRLAYRKDFLEENRSVSLQGEAFFDVQRNPAKPFIINCGEASVIVLGTSFNVDNAEKDGPLEVVVASGLVKLVANEVDDELLLNPGDRGIFDRQRSKMDVHKNEDINFLSWRTRKLEFIGSSLEYVVASLNKAYDVDVKIGVKVPISCQVTVSFDNQDLSAVLKVLQSTLGLTYSVNGKQIEITAVGC